jgi:hypothetical protein
LLLDCADGDLYEGEWRDDGRMHGCGVFWLGAWAAGPSITKNYPTNVRRKREKAMAANSALSLSRSSIASVFWG